MKVDDSIQAGSGKVLTGRASREVGRNAFDGVRTRFGVGAVGPIGTSYKRRIPVIGGRTFERGSYYLGNGTRHQLNHSGQLMMIRSGGSLTLELYDPASGSYESIDTIGANQPAVVLGGVNVYVRNTSGASQTVYIYPMGGDHLD